MLKCKGVVCALLVCVLVGIAYGAAVKIKSLTPVGDGVAENPAGDGMVILNYNSGSDATEVQVMITDFLPDTTYGVKLESDFGGFADSFAITTNAVGNGTYHTSENFNRTGNPTVSIYIDLNGDFDMSDGEIRANGSP